MGGFFRKIISSVRYNRVQRLHSCIIEKLLSNAKNYIDCRYEKHSAFNEFHALPVYHILYSLD